MNAKLHEVFRVRLQNHDGEFTIIRAESSRDAAKLFVSAMEARLGYPVASATVDVNQYLARWLYQVDPGYVATLISKSEHAR